MIYDPAAPAEEIRRGLEVLIAPGDVHELRVPKAGRNGTISGYFNDLDKFLEAVISLDGLYPGIYITLNPVNPALLARASNRIKTRANETTSDPHIVRRRWLLIDIDANRPAGISSTDHEHDRSIATACGVWDDMHGMGFPDPVVADSGNGCHLLYRIDAPNTPEVTARIKGPLEHLNKWSAPDDMAVDVTVFNPSRITKIYGTMTRKGDDTPDRPHRRSRILEVPDDLTVVNLKAAA